MAESMINYQYIQNYSKQFSQAVCERFFQGKTDITGREILEITGLRQINLMIIMDLYEAWQNEIESVKGPYFDYSVPAVQDAMSNLRNALSNNIRIRREAFEPLLSEATEKTLILIYSPYEFFVSMIKERKGEQRLTDTFKQAKKYIKVNTHLYNAFIRSLEEKGIRQGSEKEFTEVFDEVCSNFTDSPDDADQLTGALNSVMPFDVQSAYLEKEHPEKPPIPPPRPTPQAPTLAESLPGEKKTLLDEFQGEKADTLADFLKRKSVDSIRKSITINQKFMFVRELFSGDENLFADSINQLDELENLQAAERYIEINFFGNNRWQRDHDVVMEFLEVLQKKFS
jgi:hypothetical protein